MGEPKASGIRKDYTGKRVLVVEDNELNREITTEILACSGLIVELASDGREAVDMFRNSASQYYNLIFMDIKMPRMDGYEATRMIRESEHADAGEIPIIAMTANVFSDDIRKSIEAGMNEHLAKPLDLNKLNAILDRWI